MNAIAIVLSRVFVGTRKVSAVLLVHCCWAFSTKPGSCSMLAFVRVSPIRSVMSWWNTLRHTARMRSKDTPGKDGPRRSLKTSDEFLVHRVVGATVKICRGSHCVRSWWLKSLTTTCRAVAFGTQRTFEDGGRTKSLMTVPLRNSKLFHRRNCQRFSAPKQRKYPQITAITQTK